VSSEPYRSVDGPVGKGIAIIEGGPNATFRVYVADRPAQTSRLQASEIALDISITIRHPVKVVWPVFKNFNVWMNRFGYFWDCLPVDKENGYVHILNKPVAKDETTLPDGAGRYIVRKVIPERLIYFDSLPAKIADKDGVWTGHNLMSLFEHGTQTRIAIFMEHTWYSETMSIDELRAEAKGVLDKGVEFWRDYFIPDLISAVEAGQEAA
jgi:hypothetical protein